MKTFLFKPAFVSIIAKEVMAYKQQIKENELITKIPDITPVLLQITANSGCHSGLSRIHTFRSWMRSFLAYQDDKKYTKWGNVMHKIY